jgi:hypothetical protein
MTHVKDLCIQIQKSADLPSIKFQVRVLYCNPLAHKFTFTILFVTFTFTMMFKALLLTALVASASAFAPAGPGELCASLVIFKGFQSLES